LERLAARLCELKMRSAIETGARFLLDPRRKHEPTLLSPEPRDRQRRVDFYRYAVDCAAALRSECVSIWSGRWNEPPNETEALARFSEGIAKVMEHAAGCGVRVGIEPEPGMWIDTLERLARLRPAFDHSLLGLTLDVGHVHCLREGSIPELIRAHTERLIHVHLDDGRAGVHEHLMFGEGEIDFPPLIEALADAGYPGGLYVELSRHSPDAPEAARRAIEWLRPLLSEAGIRD
jgi:sugar phosphate isomerase/epimerase